MTRLRLQQEQTELIVLAVLREAPLYGYAIGKEVASRSAGLIRLGPGALYPLLSKLESSKLVTATGDEVRAEGRGEGGPGRRRKWYRLSAKGERHLVQRIEAQRRFARLIEGFVGGDDAATGAATGRPAVGEA